MIVHNPTDTKVRDYPIEDPKTGEVNLWGIAPGETLDFPDYVGSYLVQVYGFLQRVVTQEQLDEEKEHELAVAKGKQFERVKVVRPGLTNEMVNPPVPAQELKPKAMQEADQMTGSIDNENTAKVEQAVSSPTPSTPTVNKPTGKGIPCPKCGHVFQNKAAMKTHFAHNHLVIPGVD